MAGTGELSECLHIVVKVDGETRMGGKVSKNEPPAQFLQGLCSARCLTVVETDEERDRGGRQRVQNKSLFSWSISL